MLYDDAPQWMKDLVQVVVDVSISSGNQSLINNMNAILQDFAVSYVPLNQYTQSILDLGDEDTRINALIETLNSNFNDGLSTANAQIISLQLTKASKDEVVAQVIQTIAAQLADGTSNIGSTIGRIDQAIANETSARALSLQTLTASLEDTNLDVTANAEVIQNALTYVGIDEAGASTGTGLSAYLEDSNGNIGGADSELANSIRVTAEGVESKFAYNSIVNINGIYKKSGFGLTTNYTSGNGTQANPYISEFWIDASRLKFTNSNQTGQTAPFTIDASGVTPQITFNGKVAFSNVTGYTPPDVSSDISANNDIFAQKLGYLSYSAMVAAASTGQTIINGGYVNTSLLQANSINAGMINTTGLIAENISATNIIGKDITGGSITGAVITGAVIKASYLDLDGELEVLTNYHITTVMYNANPALYTDAIYAAGSNEYRIPSTSIVRNSGGATVVSSDATTNKITNLSYNIRSYDTANAGHNSKAVKIRPTFNITGTNRLLDIGFREAQIENNNKPIATFYCCGILVATIYQYWISDGFWYAAIKDNLTGTVHASNTLRWVDSITPLQVTLSNGLRLTLNLSTSSPQQESEAGIYDVFGSLDIMSSTIVPTYDFTISNSLLQLNYVAYYTPPAGYPTAYPEIKTLAYNPPNILQINNMI